MTIVPLAINTRRRRCPLPAQFVAVLLAVVFAAGASGAGALTETVADVPPSGMTDGPTAWSFSDVVELAQPKIVKIYGAGGVRGLEAYQSGFSISAEGHVLTVHSYVLDSDAITVTLDDGRRYQAQLVGADPRLDVAVLKIEAQGLPHFDLSQAAKAETGARVLAFSNLFGVATGDEPASVQHGAITVKCPLNARRGAFEILYKGPAYVLDAMTNNPGAAGGALTDRQGRLLGMLGKELRNANNGAWLNYALPIEELAPTVEAIRAGTYQPAPPNADDPKPDNPHTLDNLGLALVPDVLERTPPFIDLVRTGSPAASAGLRPDDLVLFVNGRLVPSCPALVEELGRLHRDEPVKLSIMRGDALIEFALESGPTPSPSPSSP